MKSRLYKNVRRTAVLAIIIAGIGLLVYLYWGKNRGSPSRLITVERGTITQEVSVTGKIKPVEGVDLAFEKIGKVSRINVGVGEKVSPGQILLQLESSELYTQLLEAQANVESQKAKLDELRREKKLEDQKRAQRTRVLKRISKMAVAILAVGGVIGGFAWYVARQPQTPASEIISRGGIHWHPELSIYIKGQKQEIPANIGIGLRHAPTHTHDTTGTIHLEFLGSVRKEDTRLGKFFETWDKQFNSNCILDSCNGPDGQAKMLVNGRENIEFENYPMQDKDKIEIRFE